LAQDVLFPSRMKTIDRSERKRSPIFWSLVDLHEQAKKWFPRRHGCGRCPQQLLTGLLNAATALNEAEDGRQIVENLERVRSALSACETALIFMQGSLADEALRDAMSRLDRIHAALDAIADVEPKHWPDMAMPQAENQTPVIGGLWSALAKIRESAKRVTTAQFGRTEAEPENSSGKLEAA
jgi:hypothetical protein